MMSMTCEDVVGASDDGGIDEPALDNGDHATVR